MMKFDEKYFKDLKFTRAQMTGNLNNALKDLDIAKRDKFIEVKFSYSYSAFIKAGVALISLHGKKIKGMPGHHVKIIEAMAKLLKDDAIEAVGNAMRSKRNSDFYYGGIEITEKEAAEYLEFATRILNKIKQVIEDHP